MVRQSGVAMGAGRVSPRHLTLDGEYPLVFWTRKNLYDRGTLASCCEPLLEMVPQGTVRLHPDDAAAAGVADGGEARVRSAQGSLVLPVAVDPDLPKGVAVSSQNLSEQALGDLLDPGASVTAARIEPL